MHCHRLQNRNPENLQTTVRSGTISFPDVAQEEKASVASDEIFQMFSSDQALFVRVSGTDKYRPLLHQEEKFTFCYK